MFSIKMSFLPVSLIVIAGISLVESQNCTVIEPVSNISVSNATSPAVIKWTASNSSDTCVTGYEVCLNVVTLSDSNKTCKNVYKNETNFPINGNTYHCTIYNVTITTLGIFDLRSEPFYSTQVFLPTANIDTLINISSNMNTSTILVVSHAFTFYPYCGADVTYCVSHRNPYSEDCEIGLRPRKVPNNTLAIYSGTSCNLHNITLNLTYYSASVVTTLSKTVNFSADCTIVSGAATALLSSLMLILALFTTLW